MAKVEMRSRRVDCAMHKAAIAAKLDISRRCAGNVRSQVARAAVAKAAVKAAQAAASPRSAFAVDSLANKDT